MPRKFKEQLKPQELDGLSKQQIDQHFDVLYKGYVNKTNEIEEKMKSVNLDEANATYSLVRELKKEEVFATNGARLHEGYFGNLKKGSAQPGGPILQLISEDFGSFENWQKEFMALGMAARGWVVLAFDWDDGRLHNYLTDIHSEGVWDASPLLVLDVYEHAYFIDYGTARKEYLNAFMRNIDWDVVNRRVEKLNVMAHRQGRGEDWR